MNVFSNESPCLARKAIYELLDSDFKKYEELLHVFGDDSKEAYEKAVAELLKISSATDLPPEEIIERFVSSGATIKASAPDGMKAQLFFRSLFESRGEGNDFKNVISSKLGRNPKNYDYNKVFDIFVTKYREFFPSESDKYEALVSQFLKESRQFQNIYDSSLSPDEKHKAVELYQKFKEFSLDDVALKNVTDFNRFYDKFKNKANLSDQDFYFYKFDKLKEAVVEKGSGFGTYQS